MGRFWSIAVVVLLFQFIALVAYTTHLFLRFEVSVDFAHNAQAWYLIGHGNLSPTDTVRIAATPFWQDHFDLIIWPLSLLRFIWPQAVDLLWVQDLAIVAAELVTLFWVAAILQERAKRWRNTVAVLAMVALLANPWWYETVSFDFHLPPLGLPFIVLAAYSFWKGKYRRGLIAAGVAFLCGAVVVELVFAVGVAALLSRRIRRRGGIRPAIAITAFSLIWVGVINLLDANQASNLAANYGYLAANPNHVTLFGVVKGVLEHPRHVLSVLKQRHPALFFEIEPTGVVGLITPWGFLMLLLVLIPFAITESPAYSSIPASFQNLPAMPFIFIGSFMVFARIATGKSDATAWQTSGDLPTSDMSPIPEPPVVEAQSPTRRTRRTRRTKGLAGAAAAIATVAALAAGTTTVVQGVILVRSIPHQWLIVSQPESDALHEALGVIPQKDELIASYGTIGRYADRKYLLTLAGSVQAFDLYTTEIYFLITPSIGNEPITPTDAQADVAFLQDKLHAKTLLNDQGVFVLKWTKPSDVKQLILPGADPPPGTKTFELTATFTQP